MNPSIDETIDRVEQLYATITGKRPPNVNGGGAPIPPETDPARHVEDQLGKLIAAVEQLSPLPQRAAWAPRIWAWHDDTAIEVAFDVPGVPRDQIEIRLSDQTLVVRGQRQPPWGTAKNVDACEAPVGAFERSVALPSRVEPDQITARLEAGVLFIRVARATQLEPSQIPIKA